MPKSLKKLEFAAQDGYGLALLLIFVASTILIGTSMSLILTPSVSGYLSASAIDTSAAKQIALVGFNAAQSDIIAQMGKGTTITTSYRYPSSGTNSVTIPTYPGSGSTAVLGTYYVTVNKARGYSYILTATATVNNQTVTISQLKQMNASFSLTGATAIYSLRKLVSGYAGKAVNIRCTSNPGGATSTDVGFTSSGDLDLAALKTCLGDTVLPLDADNSAKVAYGLRKLRSTYTGYAIRVQRDSDNATKDIGFDSNGNLDIVTMQNWVGTATGYVTIWYDQSNNSPTHNLTAPLAAPGQPVIIYQGTLQLANNSPTLYFSNGAYAVNSSMTSFISGVNVTSFMVARVDQSSQGTGRIAVLHKTGDANDYNSSTSMQLLSQVYNSTTSVNDYSNTQGASASTGTSANTLFEATIIKQSGSAIGLYMNSGNILGSTVDSGDASANSITPDYLVVGAGRAGSTINNQFTGSVSELIIYNNTVAVGNRQIIERNEVHYYGIPPMQDGFVTTWYDQSGLGLNLTQATTGQQPYLNITGLRPGIFFDGVDDYLGNTTANITPPTLTAFAVAKVGIPASAPANGRILSIGKTGDGNDYGYTTSSQVIGKGNNTITNSRSTDLSPSTGIDMAKDFQATALFDGTTRYIRDTQNGAVSFASGASSGSFVINSIRLGWQFNGGGNNDYWQGRINEVILYPIAQTATTYQSFESNETAYYNVR